MLIVLFPAQPIDGEFVAKRFKSTGLRVFDPATVFNALNIDRRPEPFFQNLARELGIKSFAIIGSEDFGFETPRLLDAVLTGNDLDFAYETVDLLETTMREAGGGFLFFLKDADRLESEIEFKKVSGGSLAKRLVTHQELVEQFFAGRGQTRGRWGRNLICEFT